MGKTLGKIITTIALLIFYNTHANTTLNFYINDLELLIDREKENKEHNTNSCKPYKIEKSGTLDVEDFKKDIVNIANKERNYGDLTKVNYFINKMIEAKDLIFSRAVESYNEIEIEIKDNEINLDNYDNRTIKIYYITKQKVEEIRKLKIDQITLNGEKINIDENKFQFFKNIGEEECKTYSKITEYIKNQTKNLEDVKTATNGFEEEGIDVDLYITSPYNSSDIIKNTEYIDQQGTEITIKITAQHKASYQIKYSPPEGVTLRDYSENGNIYVFNSNDHFGDGICVPKTISVKYIDKNDRKDINKKPVKEQIIHQLENIYNEYETGGSNPLDLKILEKEREYYNKIKNGNNIKLPASKNWDTLEPGDTIEVELSEKSELVKSLMIPIALNPPEGHQLTGILGKQNGLFVTITGINSINNKDAIKNALKTKLSEMRIDVNDKRLEIPQETINKAIEEIEYDYDGMLKTCNTQIPITAKDFLATEREIEQREQAKKEGQDKQDKKKNPQQFGMSEGTANCCACCSKCCKGGCCKGGCCKENNSGG